jgi:nucleotide-binding universal stress UspA family protein
MIALRTRQRVGDCADFTLENSARAVRVTADGTCFSAGHHDRMDRIVVGVDGSDCSKDAFRWALSEARLRSASLRAVYVWRMPVFVPTGFAPVALPDRAALRTAALERLDEIVKEVVGDAADVRIERNAVEGTAAQVLVQEAEGANLLVVGSRGHGGFAGLLLGSVSQQCAAHATCPVVIIRAPA